MLDRELNLWLFFERATTHIADVPVVTRDPSGALRRSSYGEVARRSQQLMHALDRLGVPPRAVVGTLAANHQEHLEAYFAIPCANRVLHTLNPRLSSEHLAHTIRAADDRALIVDADRLPLLERIPDALANVSHLIVIGDGQPSPGLPTAIGYEELLAEQPDIYPQPEIPERSALAICFTSGTTGRPKGVVYTHRSSVLQALTVSTGAGASLGPSDCVLTAIPMFHANAFAMPHATLAVGAKHVLSAGSFDPASFVDLLISERVTVSAGVPTIWQLVAHELQQHPRPLPDLRHILVGGSQLPERLVRVFFEDIGVPLVQGWGMTETSPLVGMAWPKAEMIGASDDELLEHVRMRAGLPLPMVTATLRDDAGNELPWDGSAMGEIWVRSPWVADGYLGGELADSFEGGWFHTSDSAVGSPHGYLTIKDRRRDLIKSGGEWIASMDMENAIAAIPSVVEVAVIATPDPRWEERPLPCIAVDGDAITIQQVRAHLTNQGFPSWQLPGEIRLLDQLPKTSVGKPDKRALREMFAADEPTVIAAASAPTAH